MINEETLAELIFSHNNDIQTYLHLAQVSKRFNKVSKRVLVKKTYIKTYIRANGETTCWTELPNIPGIRHGLLTIKHIYGCITSEHNYCIGNLHGICKNYHINGQIGSIGNYVNGKEHGQLEGWYIDGKQEYKINFVNGLRHGMSEGWWDDGSLQYQFNYDMGHQKICKRWARGEKK